jgi:hypothetical protein
MPIRFCSARISLAHLDPELGSRLLSGSSNRDLRLEHHGTGQRHPLLLAARELVRLLALVARQPDQLEHLAHGARDRGPVAALHPQTIGHVLEYREMGKQRVVLEHEADAALVGQDVRDVAAADQDGALVGLLEARDHAQGRRLAAARGA